MIKLSMETFVHYGFIAILIYMFIGFCYGFTLALPMAFPLEEPGIENSYAIKFLGKRYEFNDAIEFKIFLLVFIPLLLSVFWAQEIIQRKLEER